MWVPNRPQWTVIWLGFVAALWFFSWESQRTPMFTRVEHLIEVPHVAGPTPRGL